jgi:hypothetical protein
MNSHPWTDTWTEALRQQLLAPFDPDEIGFLPRALREGRAIALPHLEARAVMNRLDETVGPDGWQFDYETVTADAKRVKGTLTVLGVKKSDAGEASDEDEPLKAAVSDCLKRCAVHFGIGRYLYCLQAIFVPYDAAKRRFTTPPAIPRPQLLRALAICGYTGEVKEGAASPPSGPTSGNGHGNGRARAEPPSPHAPSPHAPAPREAPGDASETGEASGRQCAMPACGKSLTVGQEQVSLKAFGKPLCPKHQREAARS